MYERIISILVWWLGEHICPLTDTLYHRPIWVPYRGHNIYCTNATNSPQSTCALNSSRCFDVYIRQWIESSLFKVLARRLFGTQLLPKSIMNNWTASSEKRWPFCLGLNLLTVEPKPQVIFPFKKSYFKTQTQTHRDALEPRIVCLQLPVKQV